MLCENHKSVYERTVNHVAHNDMFRFFFRISDSMLMVTDSLGQLILANNEALNRLGYLERDIPGKHILHFVHDDDAASLKEHMAASNEGDRYIDSVRLISRENKNIYVDIKLCREIINGEVFYFFSCKDISRLKSLEEKFFKAFHASSVIMVVFALEDGRIIDVNESAFRLTGFTPDEMIGRTIRELNLYPDEDQRKKIQAMIIESGRLSDYVVDIRTKHGESRHVLFSMNVLTVDDELCVLAAGSDFTKRKLAEDELKKAYAKLNHQATIIEKKSKELERANEIIEKEARIVEESSRHKSEFLASMSHELRTPLNSIILLSDLLAKNSEGGLSEKEVEYVSIIKSAGRDLLELINDVLDISRVESGQMDINLSKMSLEYFRRKINGYFTEMASVKGLSFSIDIGPGLRDYLVTDVQKLEQIIRNLVSNAIKFTHQGGVRLVIERPAPSTDLSVIGLNGLDLTRTLAFSVIDTGIGIRDDQKDLVFEFFRQADKSILKKYGGTGLGLPVSRVMAQLLGGDIMLESQYGKGSAFTLYLPEQEAETRAVIQEPLPVSAVVKYPDLSNDVLGEAFVGKTILIADDDMRTTYSLIQSLEKFEPDILVASDGEKCMEKLVANPETDILLLDIAMPEMDGISVLQSIRKNTELKRLPVIAITANAMEKDRKRCLESGADAFFAKPLDMARLLHTMAGFLKNGELTMGNGEGG